jgi:2-polyprenyl-3-methyl-5-hydroxy-6-metoxy-1,4-benzoquinol methylase
MTVNGYDACADEYAAAVARRERADGGERPDDGGPADPFGLLPYVLRELGEVRGLRVLDAGCGEGYLARVLAAEGALVTGVDVAPRLVALARGRDPGGAIAYEVADLCRPQPGLAGRFAAVAAYLVLNDVPDHEGFAATLAAAVAPGGRVVLALNNPYGAVVHGHVEDYFASGTVSPYRGLWAEGVRAHHHHRTLQEYLDAFLGAGLRLERLLDVPALADVPGPGTRLPAGTRFPRFMVLVFSRPAGP